MPLDLSNVSNATFTVNGLSNLILVTPNNVGYQPQNKKQKDGQIAQQEPSFLFDIEDENSVLLETDVSDHYVEDNTAIQDQAAIKPDIVNVTGFVGELNNVVPRELALLKLAADKLTLVDAYKPAVSVAAQEAYNTAFQLYQAAQNISNTLVSAAASLKNVFSSDGTSTPAQNRQQIAFQKFSAYQKKRTLFTVQTPWAIYKDMIIIRLKATQDGSTRVISAFEISFKQIRTAETLLERASTGSIYRTDQFQGRLYSQASQVVDLGAQTPTQETPLASVLP